VSGVDEAMLSRSAEETERIGERLAGSLSAADVVYLIGDLGAGKTTFARGIARGLGASPREVASPTFALVHEYAGEDGEIVLRHLDLYRLADDERDVNGLGLPESVAGAPACVEWPGRSIRKVLPPTIEVTLAALPDEARRVEIRTRR
jgi:tRNA threonylcarbamoyladenosine biosynthesis protein TsaE